MSNNRSPLVMRVNCTACGTHARISHSHPVSEDGASFRALYCQCQNVECSHSFVMNLTFAHTISPSAQDGQRALIALLQALPKHEQLSLLQQAHNA